MDSEPPHARPIRDHDLAFSEAAFVSFARAVSLRVNRAHAAGTLAEVRRLLTPEFFDELRSAKVRHGSGEPAMTSSDWGGSCRTCARQRRW